MKTAEEFIIDLLDLSAKYPNASDAIRVTAIGELNKRELDAFKAGMSSAAEIARNWKRDFVMTNTEDQAQELACKGVANEIETARNEKTKV